jgi:hypothetical protein
MFGAAASVQNFDILGNTIKSCVLATCDIPRKLVHRQLDDIPLVAPLNSPWGHEFAEKYKSFCNEINMMLAPDCKLLEKAFSNSSSGKVLGIVFNTETLSWRLPEEKIEKCLKSISVIENKLETTLLDMQQLMGNLNHVGQMSPFLWNFRFNLNKTLAACNNALEPVLLTDATLQELNVWRNFLLDSEKWSPISHPPHHPPICTKKFFTDAAGLPKGVKWKSNIGCGVVGVDESSDTMLAFQLWWPKEFITNKMDSKGCRFGEKTSTLEQIAILVPFLLVPEKLTNQHIILETDNIACVFGHQNRLMKGDECASIFIRTVHLICAYLGSTLHVLHSPRCSDWGSITADKLTREHTTNFLEERMLVRWKHLSIPKLLQQWLDNPTEDWDLPFKLLEHVQEKLNK